jgi:hypothetical protein
MDEPKAKSKRKSAVLRRAEQRIAELEKSVKEVTETKDMYSHLNSEKGEELAGLHAVFDILPNPPPRTFKTGNGYEKELTLSQRFIAWVACDKNAAKNTEEK